MTGQRVGYVRVSTLDQNPDRQLDGLRLDRTFTDKGSGRDVDRPRLAELYCGSSATATPSSCTAWTGWAATSMTCAGWWGS
jgi:hypothetical protein